MYGKNKELVKENIKKKFQDKKLPLVDEVIELDKKVRLLKQQGDELRTKRNSMSQSIGLLMRDKKIDEASEELTQSYARKKAIPNLLTEIMTNIPKEVQLVSINNPTGKTIKIEAQSKEYEQLGYFIAKIKNEGILIDVTSTSGIRQGDFIKVTIQGQLPY